MNIAFVLIYVVKIIILTNVSAQLIETYGSGPIKVIMISNRDDAGTGDGTPIGRTMRELKYEKKQKERIERLKKQANQDKMEKVIEFMKTHYNNTNYLYAEMKRATSTHSVPLRKMVEWLEEKNNAKERRAVFKCYMDIRKQKNKSSSLWSGNDFNNLVINILKDTYNDGVL